MHQMSTPAWGLPASERRLSAILSHLYPLAPPLAGPARAWCSPVAELEEEELLTAFPCAGDDTVEAPGDGYCAFCSIVNGNLPAFKLYEDDVCMCILDIKPLSTGHSLIIPKGHFPSLQATPPSVVADICSKLPLLGNAIVKATQSDAFNILVNNGEEAGQVIFHTHVHIIPRSKGDNLWSSESYPRNYLQDDEETKSLVSCIKELLSSASEDYSSGGPPAPKDF